MLVTCLRSVSGSPECLVSRVLRPEKANRLNSTCGLLLLLGLPLCCSLSLSYTIPIPTLSHPE